MPREYGNLKARILKLLDENPGQSVKELAKQLRLTGALSPAIFRP